MRSETLFQLTLSRGPIYNKSKDFPTFLLRLSSADGKNLCKSNLHQVCPYLFLSSTYATIFFAKSCLKMILFGFILLRAIVYSSFTGIIGGYLYPAVQLAIMSTCWLRYYVALEVGREWVIPGVTLG